MPEQRALAKQEAERKLELAKIQNTLDGEEMRVGLEKALAQSIPLDLFIAAAASAVQHTKKLITCDRLSLYQSIKECAQLGLSLDRNLGHAALVPFKGKAQLIVEYRGLQRLAYNSGKVSQLYGRVVYSNDEFRHIEGTNPQIVHVPARENRGEPIAAYAVADLIEAPGRPAFTVMYADEVEGIRARSPAYTYAEQNGKKDSPWHTDPDEMWKKTAVRRLSKNIPQSGRLQKAAATGEYYEAGVLDSGPRIDLSKPGLASFGTAKPRPVVAEDVTEPEPDNSREGTADGEPHSEEPSRPTPRGKAQPSRTLSRREELMAQLKDIRQGYDMKREVVENIARLKFGDGCEVVSLEDDQIETLIELVTIEAQTPQDQGELPF